MFKLIALETLSPLEKSERLFSGDQTPKSSSDALAMRCYHNILKILPAGEIFYFVDGYDVKNGLVTKVESLVPSDFFSQAHTSSITISAIVGENGNGKSSVIDLLLRLINNLIAALRNPQNESLNRHHFVPCLFARLYFENEYNNSYRVVEQRNSVLRIIDVSGESENCLWSYDARVSAKDLQHLSKTEIKSYVDMFRLILVNYSSFSYRENDFKDETIYYDKRKGYIRSNKNWLRQAIVNDDTNKAPLIICPHRKNGLDISNELDQFMDRVFYLIFNTNGNISNVLGNKKVKKIILSLNKNLLESTCEMQEEAIACWKKLCQNYPLIDLYFSSFDDVFRIILDCWVGWYNININYYEEVDLVKKSALTYIVYETIILLSKRRTYVNYVSLLKGGDIKNCIYNISNDKRNTLSIRQCLSLLKNYDSIPLGDYAISQGLRFCIPIDSYREYMEHARHNESHEITYEMELWPAPIFVRDLEFTSLEDENVDIHFSTLSTGEKQMLLLTTTIISQLFKLSLGNGTSSESRNVCVIFDEIELYFHPKYQRKLVQYMINAIQSIDFAPSISGFHIIFATHSPFILSDIPEQNILCLENGKPSRKKMHTFAANIYDILRDHFFLDEFVGEFAKAKVGHILEQISNLESSDVEGAQRILEHIDVIGDDFVKQQLRLKVLRIVPLELFSLQEQKQDLLKRIEELNTRIESLRHD